ncbi:hypothetical protein DRE_04572 [Drechslerella stenobrocha 248]|uniref:Uncharacterized protein n=1 Tax=Drechslerella stenobrocha 248 TaxID=1043628 RepID=W7HSI2_9PEZI|nr:hypothetical protein DRE_04572 [Drechslerella stenobrocha 248]
MEWLDADDLSVPVDRGEDSPGGVLAPFMCVSLHENHIIGLPLIKVPYTMLFSKTCERAERVDRTYLAITPSDNTVRLRSKRFDPRYRALSDTNFPVQRIYKDQQTGRPMPEWDTFIDLATPIAIRTDKIEWHAEIYKAPVPEVVRFIRLYRFVHGLDFDIDDVEGLDDEGQPLDLEERDRTQKRPVELIGPGVRQQKVEPSPPSGTRQHVGRKGAFNHAAKREELPQKTTPPKVAEQKSHHPIPTPSKASWATIAGNKSGPGAVPGSQSPAQGQPWESNLARPHQQAQPDNHRSGPQNSRGGGRQGRRGKRNNRGNSRDRNSGGGLYSWGQSIPQNGNTFTQHNEASWDQQIVPGAQGNNSNNWDDTQVSNRVSPQSKAPVRQSPQKMGNKKDGYDFAGYVRKGQSNKLLKPDILPNEKDSAERVSDADRTTWNKECSQIVQEPWPEDWYILKPGEVMIEGVKDVPTREGWEYQKPNTPWWVRAQRWLELYGDDRRFKGWEYPDSLVEGES